jgi:hypothetical protein
MSPRWRRVLIDSHARECCGGFLAKMPEQPFSSFTTGSAAAAGEAGARLESCSARPRARRESDAIDIIGSSSGGCRVRGGRRLLA